MERDGPGADARDVVGALSRWEASGGHWRVLGQDGDRITFGLFSCDGGEEMERLAEERGRALDAFLAGRSTSEE